MTPGDAVRRYWGEIWSEGRFELAAEFYAAAYRENLEWSTPADFAAGAAAWRAHFDPMSVTVDELFEVGDRVVTRVTYRGRHVGDFRAAPARGRSIELAGIDIFEFVDGKVVQHWHATDHLDLFRQLGARLVPGED
jgi:steroid delta-isomerase-like uncharacterized protein